MWRYKRGAARVARGRADAAAPDLEAAIAPDVAMWVRGRARIEPARVALARGDATTAAAEARQAQTLCEEGRDPACANSARQLLRSTRGR